jgi:hypothetical protein
LRVGIYARVSTKDKGQDTENQLIQLRDHCARAGHKITAEYIDQSTSKHGERDQFKAMFDAAARHEFDAVLVWALDRFTREGTAKQLHSISVEVGDEGHYSTPLWWSRAEKSCSEVGAAEHSNANTAQVVGWGAARRSHPTVTTLSLKARELE